MPAANECPLLLQLTSGRISPTNGFTSPVRIALLLHLELVSHVYHFLSLVRTIRRHWNSEVPQSPRFRQDKLYL